VQDIDSKLSHQIKEFLDHNEFNMWRTRSFDNDLPRNWNYDDPVEPFKSDSIMQTSGIDLLVANLYAERYIKE